MSVKQPFFSVVITTKNEEKNIGNCLESIRMQTYPAEKIEIIVVDNNSTDKTKEIAGKYTKKIYNFGPERSAQRNFGVKKAKGEYVMYLDADMILAPTVIEKAIEKFQIPNSLPDWRGQAGKFQINSKFQNSKDLKLGGLYIPEIVLGNSFWSQVRRFERSFYDGTVIDCVRIVKKDIFEKAGGFDISLTGPEDWDFDKKVRQLGKVAVLGRYEFEKINKRLRNLEIKKFRDLEGKKLVSFLRELAGSWPVIFHNEAEFDLKKYLAKKSYYAQSFEKYIQKWGRNDPDIQKQFGFWYRYLGVFVENGKWKRLIRHPILALGMWLLRGLVGASYLLLKFKKFFLTFNF